MDLRTLVARVSFDVDHRPLERVEHQLEALKSRLEFLGSAEIVKGIFEMAERFSGMGEKLETAAVSAGVTAEAFQKLSFAASQNAVGEDELGGAMAKLNRQLYEARQGSETATKAFGDLGITPSQIASFRNSSDALRAVADRMHDIQDPIQKQAVAMELLGRGSYSMVKFLNQGSEAIDRLGDNAESMGAVLSTQQVEALAKLEDALSALFGMIKKVAATFAAEFAPVIVEVTHDLEKFWAAHRAVFTSNIKGWVNKMAFGLGFVVGLLRESTTVLFDFIAAHPKLVRWAGNAVLAFGALALAATGLLRGLGAAREGMSNIVKVLGLVKGALEAVASGAGTGFGYLLTVIGFVQKGLAALIVRLGVLLAETFPALGSAVVAFGEALLATPVGLFAAGLAAVTLAGEALWSHFVDGKDWKDTWIGKMLTVLMDVPRRLMAVYSFFKGGEDAPASLKDALLKSAPEQPSLGKNADGIPLGIGDEKAQPTGAGTVARDNQAAPDEYGKMLAAISRNDKTAVDLLMPPLVPLQGAPADGGNSSVSISAPVTINVPPGTPPKETAAAVQRGVQEHLDSTHRQAMRSVQTARAY